MPGARILLVEDDEVLRGLLVSNLEVRRHEVRSTATVQQALDLLRSFTCDLVILDINLPDRTGWDFLRTACRQGLLRHWEIEGDAPRLPVVVLSAVRLSTQRLSEFRPLAYLPKPFPMEALLRLAAEAASHAQLREKTAQEVVVGASSPQSREEDSDV
jgi:DNA-binding response OmpR family regulator